MDSEFTTSFVRQNANPRQFSALVLNADYRPLSYCPLSLWSWQESVKAAFLDRVDVVSEYDSYVRSPTVKFKLPSVVALRKFVRPANATAFTSFNLFLRDGFRCQYCGSDGELTFDHVVPKSQGGRTVWTNVVAACSACNLAKGNRLPSECNMTLRRPPVQPTARQLLNSGRKFPPDYLHRSWIDFLYWDAELEE